MKHIGFEELYAPKLLTDIIYSSDSPLEPNNYFLGVCFLSVEMVIQFLTRPLH